MSWSLLGLERVNVQKARFYIIEQSLVYCHRGSKRTFAQVFKARLGVTIPFRRFFKNSCVNSRFQTIYFFYIYSRNLVFLLFNVLFVCLFVFSAQEISTLSLPLVKFFPRAPRGGKTKGTRLTISLLKRSCAARDKLLATDTLTNWESGFLSLHRARIH